MYQNGIKRDVQGAGSGSGRERYGKREGEKETERGPQRGRREIQVSMKGEAGWIWEELGKAG